MKWLLVIPVMSLLPFAIGGCTNSEQKPQTTKDDLQIELNLNADATLLGQAISLGDLGMNAPAEWVPVDDQIMAYMRNHAAKEDGQYRLQPLLSYTHPSGSVLVISGFANEPTEKFRKFAARVGQSYRSAREKLKPRESWIAINGLDALQVYSATESTMHLKIIVGAGIPLSVDFTIPRQAWQQQRRAIESSLASVHVKSPEEVLGK